MSVTIVRDNQIQDIRHPGCDDRRRISIDGKRRTDGLQQDIREGEGQSDTEVETHTALALTAGQTDTDNGQDERGKGGGDTLVILHFVLHHIARSALRLLRDILAQFG